MTGAFHADQEAMRLLAESIDYSRQAQAMATALRAPDPPPIDDDPEVGPPDRAPEPWRVGGGHDPPVVLHGLVELG